MGRWAWSSGGFDWDLDGAPEILIGAGMVTNQSRNDLNSFFWRQVVAKTPEKQRAAADYENGWNALNQLIREDYSWDGREPNVFYVKQSGARRDGYRDASGVSGLDFADDTRTFAVTDFDGDGIPDLVLKSRLGPQIRAMQNDCSGARKAIAISLRGTKSNRDAIGARVAVNGQVQYLSAGSGFLSQHSKRLHFGLAGQPAGRCEDHLAVGCRAGSGRPRTGLRLHHRGRRRRACRHGVSRAEIIACVGAAREERSRVWRYLAARAGTHARPPRRKGRSGIRRALQRRASENILRSYPSN